MRAADVLANRREQICFEVPEPGVGEIRATLSSGLYADEDHDTPYICFTGDASRPVSFADFEALLTANPDAYVTWQGEDDMALINELDIVTTHWSRNHILTLGY